MEISPGLSTEILRLTRIFIESEQAKRSHSVAEALRALPVFEDIGGVFLLRDDGEILVASWDSDPLEARTASQLERVTALVAACDSHKSLAALRPVRSENALACAECGGTGMRVLSTKIAPIACGVCGGLGWLPAST